MNSETILHLTENLARGGAERQMYELLRGLDKQRYRPLVAAFEKGGDYEQAILSIDIPVFAFQRRWRWDLKPLKSLVKIIQEQNVQLIHTWGFISSFYGVLAAKKCRCKLLNGSIRGSSKRHPFDYRFWGIRTLLPCSDFLVSNSKSGFQNFGVKLDERKTRVIYNGFDMARCRINEDAHEIKHSLGIDGFDQVVSMVARIRWTKDYPGFIHAARKLKSRFPKTCFLLVGDGDPFLKSRLEAQVERLGLSGCVFFLGFREDVERILSVSDILVHATYAHTKEGTPNSVIEAMAMKLPVVASDSGGVNELVVDGISGFIIPPESIEAIVEQTGRLLRNPDLQKELGENGYKRIFQHFSFHRMVEQYQELYDKILEMKRIQTASEFTGRYMDS